MGNVLFLSVLILKNIFCRFSIYRYKIMYSIRMHKEFIDDLSFLDKYECFLVLETKANRDHYQGIISYDKKPASLRALFKKKNPRLLGNKAYSVVQCKEDIEKLKTYYCKGESSTVGPVVIKNTMSLDNIDERHKLFYEVKLSREKQNRTSLYQRVFDGDTKHLTSSMLVVNHIMAYYMEHLKPINEFQIKALATTYMVRNYPEAYEIVSNRIIGSMGLQGLGTDAIPDRSELALQ